MADTPKGDTAAPNAATEPSGPDASPGARTKATDAAKADTVAGATGADRLKAASGEDKIVDTVAAPAARPAPTSKPARSGGGRFWLVLLVLIVLGGAGGYATYPMWRAKLEPTATRFGLTLPPAWAWPWAPKAPTKTAGTQTPSQAPAPAPVPPVKAEATVPPPVPPARVADPALAGDVDKLTDRVNALERRLTAVENRPTETPKPTAGAETTGTEAVDKLGTRVDTIAQKLSAVSDELAIIREGLAGSSGEGLGPLASRLSDRLQNLTGRVSALETQSADLEGMPDRVQSLDALPKQVQTLAGRVQALEQTPAAPSVAPEKVDALQGKLDAVAGKLDGEVSKSAEDVIRLETRLASVESRLQELTKALENSRSGRERAGAFLLAANQLAATAATSAGFGTELEALRAIVPPDGATSQALATLDKHAGGIPSQAMLRARFKATASAAVRASMVGSNEGLLGQTLNRVASLVTIRRTDITEGDGLDALLNRADAALAAGDLAAAIDAVKKLDGAPAKAAAAWLADAEARAAVDGAVRALQAKALAGVAGS